jgi:hypothetical protein
MLLYTIDLVNTGTYPMSELSRSSRGGAIRNVAGAITLGSLLLAPAAAEVPAAVARTSHVETLVDVNLHLERGTQRCASWDEGSLSFGLDGTQLADLEGQDGPTKEATAWNALNRQVYSLIERGNVQDGDMFTESVFVGAETLADTAVANEKAAAMAEKAGGIFNMPVNTAFGQRPGAYRAENGVATLQVTCNPAAINYGQAIAAITVQRGFSPASNGS